jgi:hypothetical protein
MQAWEYPIVGIEIFFHLNMRVSHYGDEDFSVAGNHESIPSWAQRLLEFFNGYHESIPLWV